jgi:hypothetical protein
MTLTEGGSMVALTIHFSVFCGLFLFWKVFKRTKVVDPAQADLWTGKASIDGEVWQEAVAKNFLQKASPKLGRFYWYLPLTDIYRSP